MNKYLLFLVFCLAAQWAVGQKYLVIDKYGGKGKRLDYYIGDELWYEIKGHDKTVYYDKIVNLIYKDSLIVFAHDSVKVGTISAIRLRPNKNLRKLGNKIIMAGVVLMAADFVNVKWVQGNDYSPNTVVMITSAGLVTLGAILPTLKKKKFPIEKNRRIRIVDLNPLPGQRGG